MVSDVEIQTAYINIISADKISITVIYKLLWSEYSGGIQI